MTTTSAAESRVWGGRWIFILAATGSAVGLGNIWKFPYIAGENGGGAFVLVYLLCIITIGIPIMIGEVMIGRKAQRDPINAMQLLARKAEASRFWTLFGFMGVLAGFLILSYYSVIAGWALAYVFDAASGSFAGASAKEVGEAFNTGLLADPVKLTFWHTIFMLLTMGVVARGVNKGIETAIRVLMPALFLLLAVMLGYAFASGSFMQGFEFLFTFDFSKLTGSSVLTAMGHAFFTLSLGMGAIMVYGSYMPKDASIGSTVLTVGFLDTLVALVAGMAIFPIVFANNLEPGAGPGLLFITLPVAFGQMPFGSLFATLFFVLVSFAAWSSSISLIEPAVAWLESKGQSRKKVSVILGILCWLVGLGTVFSFNIGAEVKIFGMTFFDALDYLTANIMLPFGGLAIAIFSGWIMKRTTVQKEIAFKTFAVYAAWTIAIRFFAPAAVLIVLFWTLFQEQIKALLA
jgi:NSS family neurotransmitter:Na+ symporter